MVRSGVLVSKTPASRGFNSFSMQPIQDGDEVTWRLVAIAQSFLSKREQRLLANRSAVAQGRRNS